MKVLVTGGTGFVGKAVVRELHRAGHQVHLLVRNPDDPDVIRFAGEVSARRCPGNILSPESLVRACSGMDAVIHLVGIISEAGDQTFRRVHTEGTAHLLEAAQHARINRFLHMSALGARPDAVARYHQSKWAAEELVRASGRDWTIFRPSIIYGPGDGFVNLFAKMIRRSPVIPVVGPGTSKFQPIAVEMVARAFAGALTRPGAVQETLELAGNEVLTLDEIIDAILAVMGKKRWKVHIPLPVARFQARMLELIFAGLFRKAPPLGRDQVRMLQEDNTGDGEVARQMFQLEPEPFRTGIARYLK